MSKIEEFNLRHFCSIDDYFLIDGFYPFSDCITSKSYGVPDFLMPVTLNITNKIRSLRVFDKESFKKELSINISSICKYFDNVIIDLNFIKTHNNIPSSAYYVPKNFKNSNDIFIEINTSGSKLAASKISLYLYHELLLAYEDKVLYMKYNISFLDKTNIDTSDFWQRILDNKNLISYNTYTFAYLMYFLNYNEIDNNTTQIEADCLDFIKDVTDSSTANELFKRTESYIKMKTFENKIYTIDNLTSSDEDIVINEINSIISKDNLIFTRKDYDDSKKQLMRNWAKYQHKFKNNASKIINKLFHEETRKRGIIEFFNI